MTDKILSPDGKQEWNGTEWVPILSNSTTPNAESIVNYAQLCIDSLDRVDMAGAKTYYQKAKELDFKVAKSVFEDEYAVEIGNGYANIMETYLVGIVQTNLSANMTDFGMGVVNWDIDGDFEMDFKLQNMDTAFENAIAFLGDPNSMIVGGASAHGVAQFDALDDDNDGTPDYLQRQLTQSEIYKVWATPITKELIEGVQFSGVPDDQEALKQQYRIGLLLESAALVILSKLEAVSWRVVRSGGGAVTLKFLNEKISNAENAQIKGREYKNGAAALALNADMPIEKWRTDDFQVIRDLLETSREIFEADSIREIKQSKERSKAMAQSSECFIATAAFGTPYDSKIDILRNWRDDSLKSSLLGRLFIRNYYFFSPPIASIVATSAILRGIVRIFLTPIIHILKPKYSRPRNSRP